MIEAARQEFQANGYAATCMNDVAQRAGVSTKTMYRLIPTKADLFKSVVSDRIGRFMLEIDSDALDALPLTGPWSTCCSPMARSRSARKPLR